MQSSIQPLKGIRVVEFSHMVMGPATGLILADLGAEVIKIEPLKGDNTRRLKGSGAGYFPMYNRNKKSLCVDLHTEQGLKLVTDLVATADVVIENFRPGALVQHGLDYESLSARQPGIVYCSLKGFLSGPYAHRTALDEVAQMMGGLAYMTGLPDKPMRAGSSVIDITGAMFGVIGILAALQEKQHTGLGKMVQSALFETTAFMVGQHIAQGAISGVEPPPMSVRQSAWGVYDSFTTADNEKVFVAVVSDTQWRKFCEAFDLTDFAMDDKLATNGGRFDHRNIIIPKLTVVFAQMPTATLMQKLDTIGLPYAPVNKPMDLVTDPHLNDGGLVDIELENGKRIKLPALPIEMNQQKFGLRHNPPRESESAQQLLSAMGYSDDQIHQLIADNVIRGD
ncbi:CaiB/BaiF CoA transferase family protein [Shewanella acanthi]|uniref:CaiB/BaiF CoA transferase family protein n=1 Tax=Shewanella acanthi TaxID=2864212 RepID=UPI001C65C463|nr:CaiB/BaiF CoA-transferase family protein [Shewanella acanthi]QYJ78862.1 CoA transferase [Shewanella acanthi]